MRLARALAIVLALAPCCASAAEKVDPFAVIDEAFGTFKKTNDNRLVRGIFARALREAASQGALGPDFGLVYAMYSDVTRADNPAFALQLTEQGLSLVLKGNPPDEDLKNSLLVSRAYSLAELGRYQEAVEGVRITAVWMGVRFDQKSRDDLEKTAAGWAEQAAAEDKQYTLPSIGKVAQDLLDKARDAFNDGDTEKAREFASRAILPEVSGVASIDVRRINARSYMISGRTYKDEGKPQTAIALLRRGIDLIVKTPWDGSSKPVLDPQILAREDGPDLAWDLFSNLTATAGDAHDVALDNAASAAAAVFATTPVRRFSLFSQQAGVSFYTKDYAGAEKTFLAAAASAREGGDEQNARLAEFYAAVSELSLAKKSPDAPELLDLREKADRAANAFGAGDLNMADYVLSTAVRMSYGFRAEDADSAPLAAHAFDVFVAAQRKLAGREESQEAARRGRRTFLEIVIGSSYATEEKSTAAGANAKPQTIAAPN